MAENGYTPETGFIEAQRRIAAWKEGKRLDLSKLNLIKVPESVMQRTNLKSLNLNKNQLSNLPHSIKQLTNLQILNLDNNQLSTLPESISELTSLKEFFLSNNQLTLFPESITKLSSLTLLSLKKNRLITLSNNISLLSSLTILSLRHNQLSSIPDNIGKLYTLERLDLEDNPITELPKSVGRLKNLVTGARGKFYRAGLTLTKTPLSKTEPYKTLIGDGSQPAATINVLKYLRGEHPDFPYVEEEHEDKPLSQETSTTTFAFNKAGQFDLAPRSPEDQLDDTPEQRDRYQDLQELAADLMDLSSQQLGAINNHAKGFHLEISKDFLNCNVKMLWKFGNRLRVRLEAHTANQDEFSDGKLNPEAAARAQILISEYNVFRTYDSKLSNEDIKSFSPSELADHQEKQALIKPFIDQALKGDNFTDSAKEQVEEANEPLKDEPKTVNQQQELANKHSIIGNVIISAFSKIQAGLKATEKPSEHHMKAKTLDGAYGAIGGCVATGIGLSGLMIWGIRIEIIELIITQRDLIALYLSHTLPHTTTMNMITKLQLLWEEAKGNKS